MTWHAHCHDCRWTAEGDGPSITAIHALTDPMHRTVAEQIEDDHEPTDEEMQDAFLSYLRAAQLQYEREHDLVIR